ncbi:MAG: hypothetical protein AAB920_00360 [Patescibacteria group bacterium]
MSKEHLVPIADAQTERINARNLHLPPYLNGRIGIDLEKTTRLMNIGGISHVLLESREEDERPVPQVVGFDAQGTAYSGHAKLKTRSVSEIEERDLKSGGPKGEEWRAMKIALDTQLIAQDIMAKKGNVGSVNNWVKPLNREIRNDILKESVSFSLSPSRFVFDYTRDITTSLGSGILIADILSGEHGVNVAVLGVAILLQQSSNLKGIFTDPSYRADIFYSVHIGRAFWTAFRANTAYRNLIVAMEK